MKLRCAAALALLASAAQAQAPAPETPAADWLPLDPQNTLVVDTNKGRFIVEMRPDIAPGHVARMKALTRQGFYDGSLFYRVIKGFMAQTGDKGQKQYRSALPNLKAEFTFTLKPGTPYAPVGAEGLIQGDQGFIGALPVAFDPPAAAPGSPPAGRGHVLFCPGVASMAHGDNPDTANSQAFFMRGRGGPTIEAHFSAWGRIVQGQPVIDSLNDGFVPPMPDRITRMRVMADMPAAERPRLMVMDTRGPAFRALLDGVLKERGNVFHPCDVTVPVKEG